MSDGDSRTIGSGWNWAPEIKHQVASVVDQMVAVFDKELVGVYLHGSLAMGSFNRWRSDLDLLVITRTGLRSAARRRLMEWLLEESRRPAPIEMSIMTMSQLCPWRHPAPYDFHFSESWRGRFVDALRNGAWSSDGDTDRHDPDLATHVTVTRSRGICLWGEPILGVFPEVPVEDFRASLAADLAESLAAIERNPVYTVLNCCRSLAYLKDNVVLSKTEGGLWALASAPAVLAPIIGGALEAYRQGDGTSDRFDEAALMAFVAFARDALKPLLATESNPRS